MFECAKKDVAFFCVPLIELIFQDQGISNETEQPDQE